jgi:hypothetical protein
MVLYGDMACATGLSRRFLSISRAFGAQHRTLHFMEAFYSNLARFHNLSVLYSELLSTIVYRRPGDED